MPLPSLHLPSANTQKNPRLHFIKVRYLSIAPSSSDVYPWVAQLRSATLESTCKKIVAHWGRGLTCAHENHFTCAREVGSRTRLFKCGGAMPNTSIAHAKEMACAVGMAPSPTKFYPRVAHKSYAPFDWRLPPLNFALGWLTKSVHRWTSTLLL